MADSKITGLIGKCTDTRSFQKNRQIAFKRMAQSMEFQNWHKIECARRLGQLEDLEKLVDEQLADENLKIEYF